MRRPAAVVPLLAVLALVVGVVPALALTRAQANAIALRSLAPQRVPGRVAVLGLPAPLPAGSRVYDAALPRGAASAAGIRRSVEHVRGVAGPTWLFWADYAYGAGFEHPGRTLLVDDRSGRVVARMPTRWYPLVNAKPAAFATPAGYRSRRFVVWPSTTATRRTATRRAAAARAPASRRRPLLSLPNDCMVMIGDHLDKRFTPNGLRLRQVGGDLGLKEVDEVNTVEALKLRIANLVTLDNPPCKDVWIAINGHGSSKQTSGIPTATIGYSVRDAGGTVTKVEQVITASDVADVVEQFRTKATFKVTVLSCYAGRWVDYFRILREPNVRIVLGSSSADEPSWFHLENGTPGAPGKQYRDDSITNTTTNPGGADEFTNGLTSAIEQVLHSQADLAATGGDLAKILNRAFQLELGGDFAAQLGWTHPQVYLNPSAAVFVPRKWEATPVARDSTVYSVNKNGWAAGSLGTGTAKKPIVFKWSLGGGAVKTLALPSGYSSGSSFGINLKGHATGSFENPSGTAEHPFLFDGTSMRDLGTLGGALAAGNALNASDAVVGSSLTSAPNTFHPFLWRGGTMRDLGTLGGQNGSAFGIDGAGQVTGSASIPGLSGFHAFLWDGSMHDLGALPGYQWSAGLSIADGGMVAGYSMNPGGLQLATVWGAGGPFSLGTLPGDSGSVATGVNAGGLVVGRSFTDPRAQPHPFLWAAGTMQPLSSLVPAGAGWTFFDATAIDALGQIGGTGLLDGQVHGFLLSPPLADQLQPIADEIENANLARPLQRRTSLGYFLRAAIVALDDDRPQRACGDLRQFAAAAPKERRAGRFGDRATVAQVAELRASYGCR